MREIETTSNQPLSAESAREMVTGAASRTIDALKGHLSTEDRNHYEGVLETLNGARAWFSRNGLRMTSSLALAATFLTSCAPAVVAPVIPNEGGVGATSTQVSPTTVLSTTVEVPTASAETNMSRDDIQHLKTLKITPEFVNEQLSLTLLDSSGKKETIPGIIENKNGEGVLISDIIIGYGKQKESVKLGDLQIYHDTNLGIDELVSPIEGIDVKEARNVYIPAYEGSTEGHWVEDKWYVESGMLSFNPRYLADGLIVIDRSQSVEYFKSLQKAYLKSAGPGNLLVRENDESKMYPGDVSVFAQPTYIKRSPEAGIDPNTIAVKILFKNEAIEELRAQNLSQDASTKITNTDNPFIWFGGAWLGKSLGNGYFDCVRSRTETVNGKKLHIIELTSWTTATPEISNAAGDIRTLAIPNSDRNDLKYWVEQPSNFLILSLTKILAKGIQARSGSSVFVTKIVDNYRFESDPPNPLFTLIQ